MYLIMKEKYEVQQKIKELEDRIKDLKEEYETEYPALYKSFATQVRSKIMALEWVINEKPTL